MPTSKEQEKNINFAVGKTSPEPNLYTKSNKIAPKVFSLFNTKLNRVPRYRFLFWVNFVRNDLTFNKNYSNWQDGISLLVESITRPSLNFNTSTLNQYNKKRIVQSRVDYSPVTVTLFDTVDQKVFSMFHDYFQYYYGDGHASLQSWNYDVTTAEYIPASKDKDFGFNPPSMEIATDNVFSFSSNYFFEKLEVYEFNHKKFNKYSLIHPKITSFSYDTNSYRDMGSPQYITLTFSYEGVVWEAVNQEITEEILEQTGRRKDIGEFLEVESFSNTSNLETLFKDNRDAFMKSGLQGRKNVFVNSSKPITKAPILEKPSRTSSFNPFGKNEYEFFSGSEKKNVNFGNVSINSSDIENFNRILESRTASVGKKKESDFSSDILRKKLILY